MALSGALECPFCGRALGPRTAPGPVTCDGCEGEFDPSCGGNGCLARLKVPLLWASSWAAYRRLSPVTCDGCEREFDPSKVRHLPPTVPRRFAAAALLIVGGLMAPAAAVNATKLDFRDPDTPIALMWTVVLPQSLATGRGTRAAEGGRGKLDRRARTRFGCLSAAGPERIRLPRARPKRRQPVKAKVGATWCRVRSPRSS